MKIATISDTHNKHRDIKVPEYADIVLHAGDISGRGHESEISDFMDWYGSLPNKYKVMIAGNHDWGFERDYDKYKKMAEDKGIIVLYDNSVVVEGLIIWGSPVQPAFCNWAFNRSREGINKTLHCRGHSPIRPHWDKIPLNANIVVTHGPAHKILDETYYGNDNVGCEILAEKMAEIKPLLHVSGHIHEARGVQVVFHGDTPTTYTNTSSLNLSYEPWKDETFVFDLDKLKAGVSSGRD